MSLMFCTQGRTMHGLGEYRGEQWTALPEGFLASARFMEHLKQHCGETTA